MPINSLQYKSIDKELALNAINSSNDGVTIVDMRLEDQPLIFINTAFEQMTGYSRLEVLGKNCRFLQGTLTHQPELLIVKQAIRDHKNCRTVLKNFKKDGSLFWNELSLAPILTPDGQLSHYIGIQKDITNEIIQKQKIAYLCEHDDLTGLYNYRGFFAEVDKLIHIAKQKDMMLGIGIADIDKFKEINDYYGHLEGNNILKRLGSVFQSEFNAEDVIVARFGGDEFCFGILAIEKSSEFFYEKIRKVVCVTNNSLTHSMRISMSAGMAIEPVRDNLRIDHLIYTADLIMYENKQFHLN